MHSVVIQQHPCRVSFSLALRGYHFSLKHAASPIWHSCHVKKETHLNITHLSFVLNFDLDLCQMAHDSLLIPGKTARQIRRRVVDD